jgi:ATP-binding cassette subfamily F protein 3
LIAKTEEFIRRNHYSNPIQAEDRRKKLARLERVAPPRSIESPRMGFPPAARSGDVVLRIEGLAKAFDRPLFSGLRFDVLRGQRWGIFGPNATGKTTLLRCLVGALAPDEGRVILGHGVRLGYYDQMLSGLTPDSTPVEAVRPPHKEMREPQRRDLLARFGLTGDQAFQAIGSLSGGERSRAALARLAALDANLLVLDEPTNHLDLWARDALERALLAFDGTVLFVSHDRYFLNRVADHLLVVEPGRFRVIEGNYETHQRMVRSGLSGDGRAAKPAASVSDAQAKSPTRSGKAPSRKRRFPYRKAGDIEREILERESRIEELHAELATGEVHRDGARVRAIREELEQQQTALPPLYEHWEEALELNG